MEPIRRPHLIRARRFRSRARQRGFIHPALLGVIAASRHRSSSPQPTFANISLLIHGDARPFMDVSSFQRQVANWAARSTTSGGLLVANTSQALVCPSSNDFVFGTGSWMVAAWVTSPTGNGARIFDMRTSTASTDGWTFSIQGSTNLPFMQIAGTNYGVSGGAVGGNLSLTSSTLTHVAFSYDGTTLRCFVGGVLSWSFNVSLNMAANSKPLYIGNAPSLSDGISGANLSEMIIVKGEAVYTSAFTPPSRYSDTGNAIAAEPNAATFSNVKLQLHGNGSNGSTTVTDSSTSARTVSVFGNCQISTAQARIGSSSIAFDGTGDYCTIPQSADFAFGTGDYAFSVQMYRADSTLRAIACGYQDSSNGWSMQVNLTTAGRVIWNETGDGVDCETIDGLVAATTWRQVVVGRKGTLLMLFYEGELVYFATDSQSITAPVLIYIGSFTRSITTARDWNGYMQELRIIKGECPYQRSFTVQTSAYPDS
jgi:hypothetical protein